MSQRTQLVRLAACAMLAAAAHAGGETKSDYARLSGDLETLEAALTTQETPGVDIGFLLRSSYGMSSDDIYQPAPGTDLGGFRLQDAVLWARGYVGNYEVFIRADGSDATDFPPIAGGAPGALAVRDAWARAPLSEGVNLYFGNFRCPVLNSSMLDEGKLAFIDRTRLGQMFDVYQAGAAVVADFDAFHVKLAAQNGADGAGDELGNVARGEYKVGEGAKQREGALGAEGFDATFGLGYFDDGVADDVNAMVVDAYATMDAFSVHAELMDMGEGLATMMGLTAGEEATPFTATFGYRVTDEWEVLARFQDLDDTLETTQVGAGLNYYVQGHAAKWQVNVSQLDNDNDDGLILQIGLSLGSAFPNGAF
jgi:hypothetical protein